MLDICKGLNSQQKAAVIYGSGPSIILAGAGSGKTRVLIHKVSYLIENKKIKPSSILMITFTNKAAQEMKKRYLKGNIGYIGTFHSFCSFVLRRQSCLISRTANYVIFNDDDQDSLIKTIMKEKNIQKYSPSFISNKISSAKNMLITPKKYQQTFSDYSASVISEIYLEYEKRLKASNAFDFDDLIMKTVQLFQTDKDILNFYQNIYTHILIDEFQDTNYAQYELARLLGEKNNQITVVGDFSQSIYSWRGADIQNLQKFQSDFIGTKVFNLKQNYRSTQNILDFAYEVISKNETHPILQLVTKNIQGENVEIYEAENEDEESNYISSEIEKYSELLPHSSFAVLYRTNAQSRAIEERFLHNGIPYVLIGGTRFYERKEIKDVLSYIRLLLNSNDEVAKARIIKLGKRKFQHFKNNFSELQDYSLNQTPVEVINKIFNETKYLEFYNKDDSEDFERLENIKEFISVASQFKDITSLLEQVALVESEYSESEKKDKNKNGVRLMTLHQAKGLEFPVVFIVGVEDGILPHSRSIDDYFQLEEERRLFYVGITRAMQKLYITYAKRRFLYGRNGGAIISRFLKNPNEEW